MADKLIDAMGYVSELNKTHGIKQRGGKMYTQVVHRMEAFRTVFGLQLGVDTQILVDDGNRVVVKAIITNAEGMTVGSGMAEEIRGQGHVNTTSALENCETSAVGRALASIGLSGGEYASANEMDAVPRKAEALKAQPSEDTAKIITKVKEVFPEAEVKIEPKAEEKKEEKGTDEDRDKSLYVQTKIRLDKVGGLSGVHSLFNEMKPKIKEIQTRSPERAQHFQKMFRDCEAKFL